LRKLRRSDLFIAHTLHTTHTPSPPLEERAGERRSFFRKRSNWPAFEETQAKRCSPVQKVSAPSAKEICLLPTYSILRLLCLFAARQKFRPVYKILAL